MDQPNIPIDIPEGIRSPTEAEWEMLRVISEKNMQSKNFNSTQTLEDVWGIELQKKKREGFIPITKTQLTV